ncbi:hypothetical protein SISNIDRAFT_483454 [Sistotremastrum niveocremeum HHB9708]|uniref:Hemimethylated DNA-binding domain-containing protein n=1 Tax=Sistotremastrum niveocremeum HHB9708 TaxID=1314777 RepID=A0A164XJV7_9AGAM|nr:hypothetical protein SISNIDRAFT_483454 [Sistotremastrum niveocremeum HHB9708]
MFPVEIFELILDSLPLSTFTDDSGIHALLRCTETCSSLRNIVHQLASWRAHYHSRWKRNTQGRNDDKAEADWRLSYIERRISDNKVYDLLNDIVNATSAETKQEIAATIVVDYKYDPWDVIEHYSQAPLPPQLYSNPDAPPSPPDALARRFWAQQCLGALARRLGIMKWLPLTQLEAHDVTFQDVLVAFSTFFNADPSELALEFTALAQRCKSHLSSLGLFQGEDIPPSSIPDVCIKICAWMRSEGFDKPTPTHYHDLANHFPHRFLHTNRRCLPMSLVCIFVVIAQHLGLNASPVNFPSKVLAHISVPGTAGAKSSDLWIDVFDASTLCILDPNHDIPPMLVAAGLTAEQVHDVLGPAGPSDIFVRIVHNIHRSLALHPDSPEGEQSRFVAAYAVSSAIMLLHPVGPHVDSLLGFLTRFPLDLDAVLLRTIVPAIPEHSRMTAIRMINEHRLSERRGTKKRLLNENVKHYVGLCIRHKKYGYEGVILSWDPMCRMSESWQMRMQVNSLSRKASQPFYNVLTVGEMTRYVAEENIEPLRLTWPLAKRLVDSIRDLGMFFCDFDVPSDSESREGGMVMTAELRHKHPDEMAFCETLNWIHNSEDVDIMQSSGDH